MVEPKNLTKAMIASIKLELWYLDSAELCRLDKDEPLRGLGAFVHLLAYLRRQHNAIGNKDSLSKVVNECNCDEEWLWRIITDYGLFVVSDDGSFYSPYQRQTLGMTANPEDKPLRTRKRTHAHYSEDSDNSKDRERIEKADVRVSTDTHSAMDEGPAHVQTDYRIYDNYLKR